MSRPQTGRKYPIHSKNHPVSSALLRRDHRDGWYSGLRPGDGVTIESMALCAVDRASYRARTEGRTVLVYRSGTTWYVRATDEPEPNTGGCPLSVWRTYRPD